LCCLLDAIDLQLAVGPFRVEQHPKRPFAWRQFVQQFEPFRIEFNGEGSDARGCRRAG
jgi:hypothetical protein